MVREGDLSIVAIHRICKKAGAERVSCSASEEFWSSRGSRSKNRQRRLGIHDARGKKNSENKRHRAAKKMSMSLRL